MANPICGSCVHWTPPSERTGYGNVVSYEGDTLNDEWHGIRATADDKLFGHCKKIKMGVDLDINEPAPLAVAQDGSEYRADLYTQAIFGCALWEGKEQPTPKLSGWTSHGHRIEGLVQVGRPKLVARCGGPGLCSQCSREASQGTIREVKND